MNNKYLILLCLLIVLILLVLKKNKEDFSLISIENSALKSDGIIGKSGTFSENDLIKEAINNILPELKKKNTHFDKQLILHSFPKGSIILWGNSAIPSGWVECDGTNGTPNLTDITPICPGAGVKHKVKHTNAGEVSFKLSTSNIPRHNHPASVTIRDRPHNHSGTTNDGDLKILNIRDYDNNSYAGYLKGHHAPVSSKKYVYKYPHKHSFTLGNTDHGVSVKSASVSSRGGGRTKTVKIETLPYCYVSFIMKNY